MRLNLFNSRDENAFNSIRSSANLGGEYDSHENQKIFKKRKKISNLKGLKKSRHKSSRFEEKKYYGGIFLSDEQINEE